MPYALVIFDMDGTLTEDLLDFAAIRDEIGLTDGTPILESIAHLPDSQRGRAEEILARHELAAAEASQLHDGALEVLAELRQRGVKTALLTRNSRACTRIVLDRWGLQFDAIATRENPPYKPHPDAILHLVRQVGTTPELTLMVGDYLYDLQTARAAGVHGALLCLRDQGRRPSYADLATYCLPNLRALLDLLDAPAADR